MTVQNEAQRQRMIDAIITGFRRSFGYKPPLQIVNQILDDIDDLPRTQRPSLQELLGGKFQELPSPKELLLSPAPGVRDVGDSWIAENYPEYSQEHISAAAPAAGLSPTGAPLPREDGRIPTGEVDEQGREVVLDVDPETGIGTPMIDLGNGVLIPAPPSPPEEEVGPPPFIGGFREDYIALPPDASSRIMRIAQAERLRDSDPTVFAELTEPRSPRYRDGDHNALFANRGAEYILGVQAQLVAAGFVSEEDMATERGVWGLRSMRAMSELMAVANARGDSWTAMARRLASINVEEGTDGDDPAASRVFVAPSYREPDYATLSQSVKGLFREALGRDPLDYEVALFADQLNNEYRSEYQADVAAQRAEFEAGNHAIREGATAGVPTEATAGAVGDVDPVARFLESFESRYEGQLQAVENREQSDAMQGRITDILGRVNRLMGA